MQGTQGLEARQIRDRLRFSVERLRQAASRTQAVDAGLSNLRRALESRAWSLTDGATDAHEPEVGGSFVVRIRYAQAQAVADLARRAALQDILRSEGRLALIASMAVSRWIAALRELTRSPAPERVVRAHVDAGRVAHRMLVTMMKGRGLRSGCGQLTSAVVVAEFVHPENLAFVEDQIEEGVYRGRALAKDVLSEEVAILAAATALKEASALLDRVADRAEPALEDLLRSAGTVEGDIETELAATLRRPE